MCNNTNKAAEIHKLFCSFYSSQSVLITLILCSRKQTNKVVQIYTLSCSFYRILSTLVITTSPKQLAILLSDYLLMTVSSTGKSSRRLTVNSCNKIFSISRTGRIRGLCPLMLTNATQSVLLGKRRKYNTVTPSITKISNK